VPSPKQKRSSRSPVESIPPHPALPSPKDVGELCADIFRHAVKLAREKGADEQSVEELALDAVRDFMAACIRQSKADWKAYEKKTGVRAAYVGSKAKPRARKKAGARKK
jgi:hypothetical protein